MIPFKHLTHLAHWVQRALFHFEFNNPVRSNDSDRSKDPVGSHDSIGSSELVGSDERYTSLGSMILSGPMSPLDP